MQYLKVTLFLTALLLVASCEDELNLAPISEVGSNGFYGSAGDFEQAVNGAYASLGVTDGGDYPATYVVLSESRSDNIYAPGEAGVRDWNSINNFENTLATLGTVERAWNINFNAIMRTNTVLDQLAANAGVIGDAELATRFEAEVRFLRAFYYFDLVKWFGRVPLFETFVTPDEALSIPRAPVEDLYQLIIGDLDFAIANLPEAYPDSETGRATSLAARAILARVYMTRSGPVLHPDGPCLGTGEYDLAAEQLDQLINSGRFGMLDNYEDIFDYDNEGNAEIVWDIQFIGGGVGAGGYYPTEYYDGGWARVNLGFPGGNPGDGSKRISEDLLSSYDESDVRVSATFLLNYENEDGETVDAQFFDKFTDASRAGGDRFNWPLNYPIMRYTDVLLLRAEATLQGASGSQDDVDAAVNAVRRRAGLDETSDVDLDELLEERRREFAGENLRWDDLVRTGRVVDVMNEFIASDDVNGKMQQVTVEDIIYPVPQSQLDVKQGLYTQNAGY